MKKTRNYIWLIVVVPFVIIPVIAAIVLTATYMDRSIAASVEKILATAKESSDVLKPLKYDKAAKSVMEKFMMMPREEASFNRHINSEIATPRGLAPWLRRFSDGLKAISSNFPPDAFVLESEITRSGTVLMNYHPSFKLVNAIIGRILTLIKINASLGNKDWDERFFSLIHFVTVLQRGTGGKVNKRDLVEGAKLLSRCYGEVFPLVRDGSLDKAKISVFIKRINDFSHLALNEKVLFRENEKIMKYALLDVREKVSWKWYLPRLAFISDPLVSLNKMNDEICSVVELPPATGGKRLRDIGRKYRESLTTPLVISAQYASKSSVGAMVSLHGGLSRGRAVIDAFKVLLLVIDYISTNQQLPDSLSSIKAYRQSPVIDSLTGKEFIYRVKNGHFLLYSMGLDNQDDGGNPVSDIVFISTK